MEDAAIRLIAEKVDGDARMALNLTESCLLAVHSTPGRQVTSAVVQAAMNERFVKYDKHDEEHYNIISALHKSIVRFIKAFHSSGVVMSKLPCIG